MDFKTFAQLLYPIIGGASNQAAFVKTLFDTMVTEEGQTTEDEVQRYNAIIRDNAEEFVILNW